MARAATLVLGSCLAVACVIPDFEVSSSFSEKTGGSGGGGASNGGSGASSMAGSSANEGGSSEPMGVAGGDDEGGAPPVSGGSTSGGTSGSAGTGGSGGEVGCTEACKPGLKCDAANDRCIAIGGICDQPAGDADVLFCEDFEGGALSPELWDPAPSPTAAGAHSGESGLLLATGVANPNTKLAQFSEFGYPVRISFWMNLANVDPVGSFTYANLKLDSQSGGDLSLGSFDGETSWYSGSTWVPGPGSGKTITKNVWWCVEIYLGDATTIDTKFVPESGTQFALPQITLTEFGQPHQIFGGFGLRGVYSTQLRIDDLLITRDNRSACSL